MKAGQLVFLQKHNMKRKISTVLFFILFVSIGYSQQFSMDHARFIKDFSSTLNNTGDIRENAKSISKEFSDFWVSSLSLEEKDIFIKSANLMSSKGCKDYPDFVCLADNIMLFKNKNISNNQYTSYNEALTDLLNDGKRPNLKNISEYLMSMNLFLSKDIISKNIRSYWKVENDNFDIKYDKTIIINFNNIDLVGYQGVDSLKIYNTNAKYYLARNQWEGKGGFVGWERVGYGLDSIKAELNKYTIEMKNISYSADSVILTNSMFFRETLPGRLIDKAENIDNPTKSHYPKFTSYKQHFTIKDIVPGLDYEGGFSVQGRSFIGSGVKDTPAKLKIVKNDSLSFVANATAFYFDSEVIAANCAITLNISEDSIYHPYLTLRYHINQHFLELIRTMDDLSQIRYINTYHKILMDFTWMRWNLDKEKIEFNTISAQNDTKEAMFESMNYYTLDRYKQMQKRDAQHPLVIVTNFVRAWAGYPEFFLEDLSTYMGYSKPQVLQLILSLAYQGYLSYEPETEFIKVYPVAWEFMEAHRGTKDSDVIQFYSKTDANTTNAELSLLNFDLKINGIPDVHLSDSQNVKIYPIDRKIILKKNLFFLFDGTIQAGQFYFYGSNFKFDYNRFMIELTQCDSMKMVAATQFLDSKGNKKPAIVKNKLEYINGQFFIDDPLNKSGRQQFLEYPKFISTDKTYVYFDRQETFNKIYNRDKFYFEVEPFQLDSIKGYDPENLKFNGVLYSGGIFPPIKETLVLMENDFSLGFHTNTGPVGLPLYDGKATYWQDIYLSNEGLRGLGRINYLTANLNADYLYFFPEQMQGHAKDFEIKSQKTPVEYPSVKGKNNTLDWHVNKDSFRILKDTANFKMFDNKAILDGNLNLATTGLSSNGLIYIDNARISSDLLTYKKEAINADTSDFALYTQTILNIDFDSKNVQTKINFDERTGKFKSNGKLTTWKFPKNKYMSEMRDMTWHMDKKELEVNIDNTTLAAIEKIDAVENPERWESMFFEGPKFTSIHYQQGSLSFFSPRVIYDYENNIISAEDVKFIRVADAAIYTNNENIVIEKEAVMRTISNAKIVADTLSKFHTIYNSSVNIQSKNNYTAQGEYDYINSTKIPQKVHFDKVYVNSIGKTIASGKLTEDKDFTLSPHFGYQGDINLFADSQFLEFVGATKIIHNCDSLPASWIKFKAIIDPEEIYIPIDSIPYSINNNRLSNGLIISNTNTIYPSFLGRKNNQYDQEILTSHGFLTYNQESEYFMIASKEKLNNIDTLGNYLQFNKFKCNTYGEGKFKLSNDFGLFEPNAIGSFECIPGNDTISLFISMILDAHFNKDAQKLMADKINKVGGLTGISLREASYENPIYEYLGVTTANEWLSNLSMANYSKMPKQLSDKFILTDLTFIWYKNQNALIHYGPIGIANIGKEQVNKYIFGYIKIEKTRRGDVFEMLLEPSGDTWYYFRYSAGMFGALSSDEAFNNIVYEAKPNQRELKVDGRFYQYGLGSSVNMKRFKTDMYRLFKIDE